MRVDEVFPVESLRSVSSAYLQHGANPNFCRALLVSLPAIGGAWSRQVRTDRPLGSPRLRGPRIEPRDVGDYSREVGEHPATALAPPHGRKTPNPCC